MSAFYFFRFFGRTVWHVGSSSLLFFSRPIVSDSLWCHGLQHTRPPCPSPSPKVCLNSCPLHQWCHPAISSSDTLFTFCPQSFPASGTFPMSQLFTSGDQNTGASDSASVLPMSIQGWFPLRLIGLISLLSKSSTLLSSSVQFTHSVVSDSLWPCGLQHTRFLCPSPTPRAQTHVHPVSDTIQPSHPLLSLLFVPSIFPHIRSFPMRQFASGGQSIGASDSV